MHSFLRNRRLMALLVGIPLALLGAAHHGVVHEQPLASTFAPPEILEAQASKFVTSLKESLATEEAFKSGAERRGYDANGLMAIAICLANHDAKPASAQKGTALALAAKMAAECQDYAAAPAALEALEKAAAGEGDSSAQVSYADLVSYHDLMHQVDDWNADLGRSIEGSRLKRRADQSIPLAVSLAVIGDATFAQAETYTSSEEDTNKWRDLSVQMIQAAAGLQKAIQAVDEDAAATHYEAMQQTCTTCHKAYRD